MEFKFRGNKKKRKPKKEGFFQEVKDEIMENVIFEIVWRIMVISLRGILRLFKHLVHGIN